MPEIAATPILSEQDFMADPVTPRWSKDMLRFLAVRSQFVLTGNVRDRQPFSLSGGRCTPLALNQYLADVLALRGYDYCLVWNPIEGFAVLSPRSSDPGLARAYFSAPTGLAMEFDERGRCRVSLDRTMTLLERIVDVRDRLVAVVMDFASRIPVRPDSLTEREHEFFTKALILSLNGSPHVTERVREAHFNSVIWVTERSQDLPAWFTMDNPRLRSLSIPLPDALVRSTMVRVLAPSLDGYRDATEEERSICHRDYAERTDGLLLADVVAISQLSRRERLSFREVGEAVRRYKLGVTEDPWKRIDRTKIRNGESFIRQRLKGQKPAVVKTLDIIKRAVTGLSGAQASKGPGKPRGVLFLAGPTGVGKTELAKTLTELLFGDERAYIRFDMSEFSSEHSDQRLIGAPPGYVGYDSGGELTNAIREKPFAVVLFDEIEKAHPRILDKFLQLLDDGVLTSGRGERVYFSESVVVFTSNLGIYRTDANGQRVPTVSPSDDYSIVETRVRSEIENHFKTKINRPELLNRIGDNIVVFDFIRSDVAAEIFSRMMLNILGRLKDQQDVTVRLTPEVEKALMIRCTDDLTLGGRGIGNKLEAWLINPLSRALFDSPAPGGSERIVESIRVEDGIPVLEFQ